jgi:hypothetical protein
MPKLKHNNRKLEFKSNITLHTPKYIEIYQKLT